MKWISGIGNPLLLEKTPYAELNFKYNSMGVRTAGSKSPALYLYKPIKSWIRSLT